VPNDWPLIALLLPSVKRRLPRLQGPLLVTLVYFVAAAGVSRTFVSSFTFASFDYIISTNASVNSITTAPTKIPSPEDVSNLSCFPDSKW
jgi:hypothetical protein